MIKNLGIEGSNFPSEIKVLLVAPQDIAQAAAEELQRATTTHNEIRYIVSDYANGFEIAKSIGKQIEKPELSWVEFTDE